MNHPFSSEVLTSSTLIPIPLSASNSEMDQRIKKVVGRLPHRDEYNPLEHTTKILDKKTGFKGGRRRGK